MYRTTLALLIAALGTLAGCTDIPQLEQSLSERAQAASYPKLISVEGILASALPSEISEAMTANVAKRSSGLRVKAARLSGDVIAPDDQSRLKGGTARN